MAIQTSNGGDDVLVNLVEPSAENESAKRHRVTDGWWWVSYRVVPKLGGNELELCATSIVMMS